MCYTFFMRFYSRIAGILFLVSVLLMTYMPLAYAACASDEAESEVGCVPTTVPGFVGKMYGIGLSLVGGISLLFIILGGYFILTSGGDRMRLATGKSYITYAIIGLVLAIFGYVFTSIIAVDILRIPGFS